MSSNKRSRRGTGRPGTRAYTASFFEGHSAPARMTAEIVIPLILDVVDVRSVLDLGCGLGTWLSVFRDLGVTDILGVDGSTLDGERQLDYHEFREADLTHPIELGRAFDLVLCLEVGEHLPVECSSTLVNSIQSHTDCVLFSAAVPGQGGLFHVNEQWQSYWSLQFEQHDFKVFDLVRPRIWKDPEIPFWYRQNMLLYARSAARESLESRLMKTWESPDMLDLAHPEMVELISRRPATLRRIGRDFLPAIRQSFRFHVLGKPG